MFTERSEALRRRVLSPWLFRLYMLRSLPLAAAAGLRLESLDESGCVVGLPGGWRTRNPFGSTYFAAQCMAAEMSTGVPALVFTQGASSSVALILVEIRAVFSKRVVGRSRFRFADMEGMRGAIETAAGRDEPLTFSGRPVGTAADGDAAAEFEVTWSFKRRAKRP